MRNAFYKMICWAAILLGWCVYLFSRKTPSFAYQGMVKLFCLTRGRSNDFMSALLKFAKGRFPFGDPSGILNPKSRPVDRSRVVNQLNERGYYVFENALPSELCDRLLRFALSHPSKTRIMEDGSAGELKAIPYDRSAPKAVRYDFDTADLLSNGDVQKLLADLSFAALAQDYLGSKPVVDVVAMWWHTAFSDRPDSQAAQFFHFDMDRPKWLKFFIYLTDVGPQNGPHTFVAGSHRTGAIPGDLLKKGYARLSDEEVINAFGRQELIEFSAPRGTIIVEDTRGLHKGRHVEQGDRLMLQFQFSNSLFGGDYTKATIGDNASPELKDRIGEFPTLYTAYV